MNTASWRSWYDDYVERYASYARMRGFGSELNDWAYHRRGFIECWAQPGFHRFWQVWNPGISYFVYRLFIRLGGRRRLEIGDDLGFDSSPYLQQQRWPMPVNVALNVLLVIGGFDAGFRVDRLLGF